MSTPSSPRRMRFYLAVWGLLFAACLPACLYAVVVGNALGGLMLTPLVYMSARRITLQPSTMEEFRLHCDALSASFKEAFHDDGDDWKRGVVRDDS